MSGEKLLVDKEGLENLIEQKIQEKQMVAVESQVDKLESIIHDLDEEDKIPDKLEGTIALIVYMFMKTLLKDKDDTVGNWKKITFAALCSTIALIFRELLSMLASSGIDIMALLGG